MSGSYWSKVLDNRLSRRRALAGGIAVGGAALAATLAGCGGGNDDAGGKSGALVSDPVDTTKQAARGGTMQARQQVEGPHFDPTTGGVQTWSHTQLAYSRLVRYKLGSTSSPSDGTIEPDLVSSWEFSPDGTQVTMKLRPNVKLDQRAPTNGRIVTTEDVKFAFQRYATLSPDRGNYFTSIQPDAPIDSFQYPDANTIVMKLSFPLGSIMKRFAGNLFVVPTEADGKFDMRQDMRGSGPWMLTSYQRSQGWQYQRNPNWYMAGERPFLDGIDYALISESATALAQFKAKRLWSLDPSAESVSLLKKENPDSILHGVSPLKSGISGGYMLAFSKLENSAIQKDVRIRYAISMLIDRDLWIDTFYNVKKLESEGLPMETGWNSHIACSAAEWLDPKTGKLGEASKYFKHDPEEAAKLLRAAGKFPMETEFSYATSNVNRPESPRWMQVLQGMMEDGGHFKLKVNTGDYIAWYQPTYLRGRGQWEGLAWTPGGGGATDIDASLWGFWAPNSRNDGVYDWSRVPGLQDLMTRERRETDDKKRTLIVQDFQREMAKQMPCMLFPGLATSFSFYWPWMGNHGVFKTFSGDGDAPDTLVNVWYDKSKDTRT
jgi:peptide/nickel transport system substrate-binding protein